MNRNLPIAAAVFAAAVSAALLASCQAAADKPSNGLRPSENHVVLDGTGSDRPANWKPPANDGRSSSSPAGATGSQPQPGNSTGPSTTSTTSSAPVANTGRADDPNMPDRPAGMGGPKPTGSPVPATTNTGPAPAATPPAPSAPSSTNTVANPSAMVRPPAAGSATATNDAAASGALSAARVRTLAAEAQSRGEYASAASLWCEYTALKPTDGDAQFRLAQSLAAGATPATADKLAREAADAARLAWSNGVAQLAKFTDDPAFKPISGEAAWVGVIAELKVRAEKLAAAGK
jgi:hypothetical protein